MRLGCASTSHTYGSERHLVDSILKRNICQVLNTYVFHSMHACNYPHKMNIPDYRVFMRERPLCIQP